MSEPMQFWTLLFGAATVFLILVQVAMLDGLFWAFRLFQSEYRKVQQSLKAEGIDARQLVSDLHRTIVVAETAAAKTIELASAASGVIAKAHKTVDRVDSSLHGVLNSVGRARTSVQRSLGAPAHEYRAIRAAVKCALAVLHCNPQPELFTGARR